MRNIAHRLIVIAIFLSIAAQACAESFPALLPDEAQAALSSDKRNIALYYPSGSSGFATVQTSVDEYSDIGIVGETLSELFSGSYGDTLNSLTETSRYEYEYGCGTVSVCLSAYTPALHSDQDLIRLSGAIGNTLLALDEVNAVSVLIAGSDCSISDLPLGVMTEPVDSIAEPYIRMQTDRDLFVNDGISYARKAMIYYPSSDGPYLLPVVRELEIDSEDLILPVLDALTTAQGTLPILSPVPSSSGILCSIPEIRITDAGQQIAVLDFTDGFTGYAALADLSEAQAFGSVALSLFGFIPGIDGILFSINGSPVTEVTGNGNLIRFKDGIAHRSDFSGMIGSTVEIFFSDSDGKSSLFTAAVSRSTAVSPKGVLMYMISAAAPESIRGIFPEGTQPYDILRVDVRNGIACVDLSAALYCACQSMKASEERRFVYGIVNTLCRFDSINSVFMTASGHPIDILSHSIHAGKPLMPSMESVITE